MRFRNFVVGVFVMMALAGCATSYGKSGFTGGFTEKNLQDDIWRITFGGNGYSNPETVQTYWLYRCSELAIEKGFDGFEILSPINLSSLKGYDDEFSAKVIPATMIYVPMYMDTSPKPSLTADIRFIKKPFTVAPPRVFDAVKLKEDLTPYVTGPKCDLGNVCAHVHKYLYPVGPTNDPV